MRRAAPGVPRQEMLPLETAILWTHALAGAAWAGASGCFAIAGLALAPGSEERARFAARGAPRINQFAMLAAIVLALSGIANLFTAIRTRHGAPSPEFIGVLAAKIVLYLLMLAALGAAIRIGGDARLDAGRDNPDAAARALGAMTAAHIATLAMGAIALMLGLWLMGS